MLACLGKDEKVCQADVFTPSEVLRRAIAKLSILNIEPKDGGSTEEDVRPDVSSAKYGRWDLPTFDLKSKTNNPISKCHQKTRRLGL